MNRFLIIKISALGDVVLALPHIQAIAAHHRADELHLVTGPAAANLFEHCPGLRVKQINANQRLGGDGRWGLGRWVRGQGFDGVYDLQGNSVSKKLVRASGAGLRVGTQPDPVYNRFAPGQWRRTIDQNAFDRLNQTLAAAGVPQAVPTTGMVTGPADTDRVEAWMGEKGLTSGHFVVMHAGCNRRWKSKRWPVRYFVQLAQRLDAAGLPTVWAGALEDGELNRRLAGFVGIDATGAFTLRQTFVLAARARLAVSNDSCPMHLFALTGIPVFSFFGPTNWQWSHPAGQGRRVIRTEVSCSPCFKPACPPAREHACMERITPEGVFERIAAEICLRPLAGAKGEPR
ncbi:MAG: glycosyltransferase family 9 protein [Desulfobacterales bacterium]|nr:glycosyltransferase family 9 protein [Desulfobacterales bacterium]